MDDQPKVLAQTASTFFYDGSSMRQPVPGTVPIGGLKEDTAFFTGKGADGQFVATIPVTVDEALVERGRQRYAIYCQPCHDARGDGKGILFQRGNVPTASFHQEKILKYPDGQIFDVITNGSGLMSGYRWPIPPADRWAIIAYVRELERKRLASATGAPAGDQLNEGAVMNRKLLVLLGPVAGLVMFAGDGQDGLVADEPRVQGAVPAPLPRPWTRRPAPRDWPTRRPPRPSRPQAKPYEEAEYRTVPRRRKPRGHLGGRAAAPAVRGVRPRRPDLRVHHRGDRLQDRRHAIRPARARVHEAALRLLLAHRDLRRVPDVHAHHPVSEVHELPDERVLSDLPPVRPALLRGSLLPLHLLLRLGEVPSPGASRPGARPQRRRHGASC